MGTPPYEQTDRHNWKKISHKICYNCRIYEHVRCVDAGSDNEDNSALTFLSEPGMYRGIIYIMSKYNL